MGCAGSKPASAPGTSSAYGAANNNTSTVRESSSDQRSTVKVQVAADIFGNKLNFELSFPSRPTVSELHRAAETAFSNEIQLRRPAGVQPHQFRMNKMKVYNEDTGKWVDLRAESQLIDSCQCYAFQVENPWHRETQQEIPPAVRPPP
eukprot:CAMPEP_0174832172 /NCGR_PEP_ID=MMETSP1114-20130205/3531_1 /TAXON_ID=312471 /ORGANISM="Neobodo designis, Strain CCAP 1951/1" /LENGTH=147 /DNA_ID=CAMNT_0016066027 /DNA_START=1 /DNA_END=440 /DNA_ORIENTATION=-